MVIFFISHKSNYVFVSFASRLTSSPRLFGEESPDSKERRTPQKGGLPNVVRQTVLKKFIPPMASRSTGKGEKVR